MRKIMLSMVGALIYIVIAAGAGYAAASFQVTNLVCSPAESKINSPFSCTATIQNSGDASGTVGTVTLFPDVTNWLENANYPKTIGQSVGAGESVEVTFTGLKGSKSGGNNGFSRLHIDDVADTSGAVTGVSVNIIDVSVAVSQDASSAAMGATFTTSSEVTAGGNSDIILTWTVDSGGCSIGNQDAQKTMNNMQDGNKQSKTWTVTMGTSGDCVFTVAAAATGAGGVATKTTAVQSTVDCTDCPTGGTTSTTSSSSGGGGGGGASTKTYTLGETGIPTLVEFAPGEVVTFITSGESHSLKLQQVTEANATVIVSSKEQVFTLTIGEEISTDLNEDGIRDITLKLKSVNILTKKASFIITSTRTGTPTQQTESPPAQNESNNETPQSPQDTVRTRSIWVLLGILFFVILAGASGWYYLKRKRRRAYGRGI